MSRFIIYNSDGKILRTGRCPLGMVNMQAQPGEFATEGTADDLTQKISVTDDDVTVVDKTPAEIAADNPPPLVIADEDKPAIITNKDLAALTQRVKDLEDR